MRVVVLGAGGPAGINSCRAIVSAGHEVIATDSNADHLGWGGNEWQSAHMPEYSVDAINELDPDFVLPQPDGAVRWLALHEHDVEAATFLPHLSTIDVCQDKEAAQAAWWGFDLTTGATHIGLEVPDYLKIAEDVYGLPFWLRADRGAGARCALKVADLRQAYHWIRFWQLRDDVEFIAEEYLPGRDLAWTGIYWHGELVTSFLRERLEYLYPHLTPTGLTGTPTRARIVHDATANAVAEAAVAAVAVQDGRHGIMSVDMKEDANGTPRPTEINAGRGFTTLGLWSLWSRNLNFLEIVATLAVGSPGWGDQRDAFPEGLTLHRHIDAGHTFVLDPVLAAVGGDPE